MAWAQGYAAGTYVATIYKVQNDTREAGKYLHGLRASSAHGLPAMKW